MRVDLQPCYVLHRRDFRNTSLIVELFSHEHGRIGVVARGARQPRSPKNALLQVFQPLLVSWTGKGELATLTQVEAAEFVKPMPGPVLASAYYLNELIYRLLRRGDAHEELFRLYAVALSDLRDAADNSLCSERSLRLFEKQMLQELGYGLVLDHEVNTGEVIDPDAEYTYVIEHGPVLKQPVGLQTGPVIAGRSLIALAENNLDDRQSLRECKHLMRAVLQGYIGDKPLQSRMLYNRKPTS